jgi:hypothetical protein
MRAKDIVSALAWRHFSAVSNLSLSTPNSTSYRCKEAIQSARWLALVQPHSLFAGRCHNLPVQGRCVGYKLTERNALLKSMGSPFPTTTSSTLY